MVCIFSYLFFHHALEVHFKNACTVFPVKIFSTYYLVCDLYILIAMVLFIQYQNEQVIWFVSLLSIPSALPIPVVVITGGVRHDSYLIRSSFDHNHPHYEDIKA